jgi:DNA-directed RNA polymerase specialized sigma24 family protein
MLICKIRSLCGFLCRVAVFLDRQGKVKQVCFPLALLWAPMASPSPSDLVWIIGFTPHGRWIAPVMRAAVRAEWPDAKHMAASQLGDESLAHELMEAAIQQTKEELADLSPVGVEEARTILGRSYRNAIRRERRARTRLMFEGTVSDVELLLSPTESPAEAVHAEHDLATILRDTPHDVKLALLMRYGARSRWDEVAEEMQKSKDSIRIKCQRELKRIRKRLGIRGRPE